MKPKRFYFRSTPLFSTPLRYGAPVFAGLVVALTGLDASARDILRPSSGSGKSSAPGASGAALTRAATDAARANTQDILRRTGQTLDAMQAMQAAARAAAQSGPDSLGPHLPVVPNGLRPGGLNPAADAATNPASWSGASQPVETVSGENVNVTIRQTTQQALLNWQTLNVGKKTTLTFDQSAGGESVSQWIAFNQVNDPTGNPTQILGNIKADGQVYLINRNGVIFGGSSQVNARGLTVSSLPINKNLVSQGLLNNRDAQFLFSGLFVPGGADGTPDFTPEPPPASGRYGDVIVQPGAVLTSPASGSGNGGRITLVGPNVTHAGSIITPAGQAVLAAGLQVGIAAHDGNDPSLRGLDVWVGDVGDYAGTVNQTGLIESLTGSASITGRLIQQLGIIESSTSVNLNGRIDLKASYGAVANPNFDSASEQGAGGPMFFNQFTGLVTLGGASVTRILPDYASSKAVPGTSLPERSQVNIEALAIHFDKGSQLFAPNGEISIRAGVWPYKDADGNRTIFGPGGAVEAGITNYFIGVNQRFLFDGGQIYIDEGATINVAGSVDVFVPLAQNILEVEFRGAELADSPLQRESNLRGESLTVDIRQSGAFNGKFWVGTPLGDVTGLAGIIERNVAQLTAEGGNITLQAGGSIVVRKGATLDVSGGFYSHEGGMVNTSSLVLGGRKVAVKNATPDRIYDGVYSGKSVFSSEKWGITQTFHNPLAGGTNQIAYDEGASGGQLTLLAPSMALDGEMRGITVEGPRQRSSGTLASSLRIRFEADRALAIPGSTAITFFKHSPTPPLVLFSNELSPLTVPEFSMVGDSPVALPAERVANVVLSPELLDKEGFGSLEINNPDGEIVIPENVTLSAAPKGSVTLYGASISVDGSILAPGGVLSFTTYNISPSFATEFSILTPAGSAPFPLAATDRGMFTLGREARLSTAGLIADDTPESPSVDGEAISSGGGEITVKSYNASFASGSIIDVSGGVYVSDKGSKTYGKAGIISLVTGTDVGFTGVIGGSITLSSTLRGYSGSTGGTLNLQASLIEVGGAQNPGILNLTEDFFRTGGFSKYSLTGIGVKSSEIPPAGQFESYIPAISIAANANIRPLAESFIAEKDATLGGAFALRPFVNSDGLRSPVSLSFTALGSDDPFTLGSLEARGDIVMGASASILTEPAASVSFKAGTITLLGSITAPGGQISVAGAGAFPLTSAQRLAVTQALATVHLGEAARLSVAGAVVLKPDVYGRRVGAVLDGGSISISGNILAEKGGLLDASGASDVLDLSPSVLAGGGNKPAYLLCGINIPPCNTRGTVATRLDSDGGTITLTGSQMLASDAILRGSAGGLSAIGGSLSVSSGRYYPDGSSRTSADFNLVVKQSGDVILNASAPLGVGIGLKDGNGAAFGGLGLFSLERMQGSGFSSLNLGGNIEFQGPIHLHIPGALRLASGGVVQASSSVALHSPYIYVGQEFRPPENPGDSFFPFMQEPAVPSSQYFFAPTFGAGKLLLSGSLIDVGTLSLQNIGRTDLVAFGGDIRGNGTLSVAGDLALSASRIYPTSASSFSIFAYDHARGSGSVTISASGGSAGLPLSAGGDLSIYASSIHQHGVLRAPLGSITLGWDGTDLDLGDSDFDSPFNPIAGSTIASPIAKNLILGSGSLTSVSAANENGEAEWIAPYGMSPDGETWIDPRGVNVTLNGLPVKTVSISAGSVNMHSGAVVDIRGGGDLLTSRWVPGNGGSIDLLSSASSAWSQGTEYQPGDLVSFGGETWSAKLRHDGQSPTISTYWSKVAESFAIIPTSGISFAPYNSFNTGSNAGLLAGDPGFVNSKLKVGDTITLDGSTGVPAGNYTLLPRRYALLPGAFLVTPVREGGVGLITKADGAQSVSGFVGNRYDGSAAAPPNRSRFEIISTEVLNNRVEYDTYTATSFLGGIAASQGLANAQELPKDAGYAGFNGVSALQLAGSLRTQSFGKGSKVDISSLADIRLVGSNALTTGGEVSLQTSILNSWNVDSLVIGGIRRGNAGAYILDVKTDNLSLDNSGETLSASDVVLVSKGTLKVAQGSSLTAFSDSAFVADAFTVVGDGALVRVSADARAVTTRTGFTGATTALIEIGAGAKITGGNVILDSTYGTRLASNLELVADWLTLGSGQISVVQDDASGFLPGLVVDPHLVLSGSTLNDAFASRNLTLRSYRSIDVYGTGVLGSANLQQLVLSSSGIRGYEQAGGNTVIRAGQVTFENSVNAVPLAAQATSSGSLTVEAGTIRLGANSVSINGYQNLALNASAGLVVQGTGAFSTTANLNVRTPVISGEARTSYAITSTQAMVMERAAGTGFSSGALGAGLTLQGETVKANTDILLPSGKLVIRATSGNLEIGGNLSVEGASRTFGELTRYAGAGTITLESLTGDVFLSGSGIVSVAAAATGGSAGVLDVRATNGSFVNAGLLKGTAAAGFDSGEFVLDTGGMSASGAGSFGSLNASLDFGGFFNSRSFRLRNGDVTVGSTIRSREFSLATDRGSILVTGEIDASGQTGGSIALAARDNLTLASGSKLTVAALEFSSAGKGGSVLLEAGTQSNGLANTVALLDLQAGSTIDLSVAEFVPGLYTAVGSSASQGKFTGTLHLRAPRTDANNDLGIAAIQGTIIGASSIVAEGYKVYAPVGGVLNIALRGQINTDAVNFLGAAGVGNANEVAMRNRLLGTANLLDSIFVIAPGAEIINRTGDLTLGLANNTSTGSASAEALASADWDLSAFRYGSKAAAGVLTLRAQGDLVFNNTLSDGFDPIAQGSTAVFTTNGHSLMWLATLKTIRDTLPVNTQSWSYRLTAGADLDSSNFRSNLAPEILNQLQPGKGSVLVGEFYPAVPNSLPSGASAGIGEGGLTANTIRISTTTTNRGNRFEVIRTGTGDIAVSAGRDVQLRNQFSTIYTAGVALPNPTTVFSEGDFVAPILPNRVNAHPNQTSPANLGIVQQLYPSTWSIAGGNISLTAAANIGRYTLVNGVLTVDTTRQVPNNWLYRRGYVNPATGLFASDGGFGTSPTVNNTFNINDPATSTTWWIDYSNFFQGVGTLGGGDIELTAGNDIVNVDAVAPTNARMVGRRKNPDFGLVPDAPEYLNLAPDAANLLEHGGGAVTITAGRNIDGGLYYAERGAGELNAGGEITTNAARTLTTGILSNTAPGSPFAWLPTQLYVGKSSFDVTARGNVLLGTVSNTFLLPQGVNNKFWYKTYFNTLSENAGANVVSLGGDVTHRTEATAFNSSITTNLQQSWYAGQNLYDGPGLPFNSSHYQPWLRLSEVDLSTFGEVFKLFAPNLRSTAFGGNVNLVGDITLSPSVTGTLELIATGGIIGLNQAGPGALNGKPVNVWTSSTINVSDAAPESIPGIANPLAYQVVAGRDRSAHLQGTIDILAEVSRSLKETGSFTGEASSQRSKSALHDSRILHTGDPNPVTLYASGGDVIGLTLFAPKKTRVIAGRDILDVALYLQNVSSEDITLLSAGRDIIPFNESSELRGQADNIETGNYIGDPQRVTVLGATTKANSGDIRISGPGLLEVTSGRKIDLGTGSNFSDGTGTGISSIGNLRNPFLPFGGANIIALAGVTSQNGNAPAYGLSNSSFDIAGFISSYMAGAKASDSSYWRLVGADKEFEELTPEQQAVIVLEKFYQVLRDSGRAASATGNYDSGYQAVAALFGTAGTGSDILTRSREIRTTSGGSISLGVPNGGITMASNIAGNPLTPPGVVTEYGGSISTFTDQDVNLGQARIFTLRGGDIVMWSSNGDIAAGTSPRTVVTAPPTRVVLDTSSANVQTDLGGLATGGGIGVLAVVEGVPEGNVDLIAPRGAVDAGDAGIRVTGNLNIAAQTVLNAGNISAGGSSTGTSAAAPSAPSISTVTSASNSAAAASSTVATTEKQQTAAEVKPAEEPLSLITVEVIGYGGVSAEEEDEQSLPQE